VQVPRLSKWLGRLVAVLAGVALLGGVELLLRVCGYRYAVERVAFRFAGPDILSLPEVQQDRVLFWRLRPGAPEVGVAPGSGVTNAAGFRGPVVPRPRSPGVARVACLGDSITYGVGVAYEQGYVGFTGRTLEWKLGRRVEMVDAGCPGYTTFQGLRLLESDIVPLAPDVVTLMFGSWNDFTPAVGGDDEAKGALLRGPAWLDPLRASVGRSRLFMAMAQACDLVAGGRRDPRFGQRSSDEYMRGFAAGRPPEGERVPPEKFRANLEAMVRLLRARRIQVVLLTPPLSERSQREYPVYRIYRDLVHEVARGEGVPLVMAAEHLAGWEGRGQAVFGDWVHPNQMGHEIVSALLTPVLMDALRPREPAATAGSAGGP
jgi:lysophospholipase L1-like esterase